MLTIIFLLLIFINSNLVKQTQALSVVTHTPTPEQSADNQNKDIQKIREVVQQKVKEKLAEITAITTNKKAFIGIVQNIDKNDIIISYNNQQFQLQVDVDTVFIDSKRNKTGLDQISLDQAVLAMGYLNESQALETKRLIIVPAEILLEKKHTIVGKIVDISQETSVFVLIPNQNKDHQYQIKTDSKTKIINKDKTSIKFDQLENGQTLIVIFSPTQTNSKTYYAHQIIKLESPDPSPTPESSPPEVWSNLTSANQNYKILPWKQEKTASIIVTYFKRWGLCCLKYPHRWGYFFVP